VLYDNTDWTISRQPITDFAAFKRGFQLSDMNEMPGKGNPFLAPNSMKKPFRNIKQRSI
jgi:hypothetical protein